MGTGSIASILGNWTLQRRTSAALRHGPCHHRATRTSSRAKQGDGLKALHLKTSKMQSAMKDLVFNHLSNMFLIFSTSFSKIFPIFSCLVWRLTQRQTSKACPGLARLQLVPGTASAACHNLEHWMQPRHSTSSTSCREGPPEPGHDQQLPGDHQLSTAPASTWETSIPQ